MVCEACLTGTAMQSRAATLEKKVKEAHQKVSVSVNDDSFLVDVNTKGIRQ